MFPETGPYAPRATADSVLSAVTLAAAALLLSALILFPYGRDQGVFAVIGQGILDGDAPYRDRWDLKPPGIFFVYALARAIFGSATWGIRVMEAAAMASLLPAFRILSRTYIGAALPGTLAFGVAVLMHVQLDFWHTAQAESFGGVLIVWAVVCAALARGRGLWLATGALYGAAFLLKPFLAAGALAAVAAAVSSAGPLRGGRWRTAAAALMALVVGFAIPTSAVVSYFGAMGALGDMSQTLFVFAPHYAAIEASRASFAWFLGFSIFRALLAFGNVTLPGLTLLALAPPHTSGERRGAAHVATVALLLLAGVAWQAKLFAYHYGAVLPLLALLAGWGLWKGWIHARSTRLGIALFGVTIGILAALPPIATGNPSPTSVWLLAWQRLVLAPAGALPPDQAAALSSLHDVRSDENRIVSLWLRQHTPEGGTLFVWGFQPVLYDQSGRRPASRYITNQPQRVQWSREASRAQLMKELNADPPDAVVVARGDVFPRVVGNDRDSAAELESFPELRALLDHSYSHTARLGRFDVFVKVR